MNLADLRREYSAHGLRESDVDPDPIKQFAKWFGEAGVCGEREPNAMTLATCTPDGLPSARVVLLKGYEDGFTFFTNYDGRKARELDANPRAALLFYWSDLERQVRIEGTVERTTADESADYFAKRPRGSQLGAWASRQSAVVAGRPALEAKLAQMEARFPGDVPCPPFWGGYRVRPMTFEFWQGRPNRLHDRLRYRREGERWVIERLSP